MKPSNRKAVYPHFEDLVEDANVDKNQHASIKRWLEVAQAHLHSAQFYQQDHHADHAYVNFTKAAHIIAHIIPSNRQYPTFTASGSETNKEYIALQKNLRSLWGDIEASRKEIKENNRLNGTQRRPQTQEQEKTPKESSQQSQINSIANGVLGGIQPADARKRPPPVPPKPAGPSLITDVKSNGSIGSNSSRPTSLEETAPTAANDLNARFERLRSGGLSLSTSSVSSVSSQPLTLVSPDSGAGGHQLGSRGVLPSPRLNTSVLSRMPRPPSPTYSPTRNLITPTRNITRKPTQTNPPVNLTDETILSPSALSSYMSRSTEISLLVLDVRERTEFDDGHINVKFIVCIEPLQLRKDMSGEELEDLISLSLVPKEHELFANRHNFDLIVYYDNSTASDSFLIDSTGDEHAITLQRLHQAICDFSYEKVLKRPPVLLAGGLKAWTNLFGTSSLVLGESQRMPPLPYSIPPFDERNNQGVSRKKNDFARKSSIDIDAEKAWLQKLQKEREPLTISVPMDSGDIDVKRQRRSTSIVSMAETFPRTVEQFFQQWPASPSVQSMMSPIPGTPAYSTPLTPSFSSKRNTIYDHPFHGFTDVRNPEFNPPQSPIRPPPALPRKSYKGESEKPSFRPIEPPPSPTGSPMVGLTASPGETRALSFGTVGLKNLGNTCYMNSVLQCMNGTIPLARYFLDGSYKMHLTKDNPLGSQGRLTNAFATIVKHLWEAQYKFISPVTFRDMAGEVNGVFANGRQQDAQEFLEFLLDYLHEDLNPNASRSQLRELTTEEEQYREGLPIPYASFLEWQRYIHRNYSVIVNWFQGQLCSRLTCMICKTRSTTYTPFMYLSLPVPPKKHATIQDCLTEFCREEVLDNDDAWYCPACKKARKATKKLTITRLPHILIIHLKRFTNDGRWNDKLTKLVQFPLKELGMSKYVPQLGDGEEGGVQGTTVPGFNPPPEQTAPFLYDLYGVVNHYGTLTAGHYTSFVRDTWGEGWRLFDDTRAKKVQNEDEVISSGAYVLFWVRRHIM